MEPEIVRELEGIVGRKWVITDREATLDYLVDETPSTVRPSPAENVVLVKPATTHEISSIMKLANKRKLSVFPRGGGTGLVGGAIPTEEGILLSMERLNRIIEIDRENLMVVVEAGVTLERLEAAASEADLLLPPHPGDEAAHVGGLVACNAGGARALRYGVMRNYVKGMEVVLPTGEILHLGGKLLKNVSGYDLMHLIIGSQGTLGVITKAVLRLYPKFRETATLIIPFDKRTEALVTVCRLLQDGIAPLAIEYVEGGLMEKSAKQIGKTWPLKEGKSFLLIIVTGNSTEEVLLSAERIDNIAREHNAIDTLVVTNRRKQKDILDIRSKIYNVLKPFTMDITDIAVPPARIAQFMNALDDLAAKYETYFPTFGHAGDGNLHTHILTKEAGGIKVGKLENIKEEIYTIAIGLGGALTAEHGIGKIRVKNLVQFSDKKLIELTKKIKRVFDPNNVLNPGTVIP